MSSTFVAPHIGLVHLYLITNVTCFRPLWSIMLVAFVCILAQMSHVHYHGGRSCCSRSFAFYYNCHMSSTFVVAYVGRVDVHFSTNVTCLHPARSGWARICSYRQFLLGVKLGNLQLFNYLILGIF